MPTLKYARKEDVPADLLAHAKDENGAFVINIVPAAQFDELRTQATQVAQERDTLNTALAAYRRVAGDDPNAFATEVQELRGLRTRVSDGKLKTSDEIAAEVERRTRDAVTAHQEQITQFQTQIGNLSNQNKELDARYRRSVVDQAITNAVLSDNSPINPAALPDILTRAYGTFQVSDGGQVVPRNGEKIIYGADGVTPMSPSEWLGTVLKTAPYLGKTSAGGGASGSSGQQIAGMSADDLYALSPIERLTAFRKTTAGR